MKKILIKVRKIVNLLTIIIVYWLITPLTTFSQSTCSVESCGDGASWIISAFVTIIVFVAIHIFFLQPEIDKCNIEIDKFNKKNRRRLNKKIKYKGKKTYRKKKE